MNMGFLRFKDFMLEQDKLEEELYLREKFFSLVKNLADKIYDKALKTLEGLKYERDETKKMIKTFFLQLKKKVGDDVDIEPEEIKQAAEQLLQVGKLAAIAPIFIMPGGGTTTAILYTLGKKFFDVSILPKGLEKIFEKIDNKELNELFLLEEQM